MGMIKITMITLSQKNEMAEASSLADHRGILSASHEGIITGIHEPTNFIQGWSTGSKITSTFVVTIINQSLSPGAE